MTESNDNSSVEQVQERSTRRRLDRLPARIHLIRALAVGAKSQEELAQQHEVTQGAISHFAKRHAEEIAHVAANLEDEYAGLWIADSKERLTRYMDDVEKIDAIHTRHFEWFEESNGLDEEAMPLPVPLDAALLGAKQRALKAAAEERGQLAPTRFDVAQTVRYEVAGVDPEELT